MKSIRTRSFALLLAVVVMGPLPLLSATSAWSAAMVVAEKERFFPVAAQGARGGGVAAIGQSTIELVRGGSPDAVIRIAGTAAPVQGAWWFPDHLPLTNEQALLGDARARLLLSVNAAQATKGAVTLAWRVANGEPGQAVTSETIDFAAGKPTEVQLPLPPLADGATISGLMLGFSQPGSYEVRRIALGRQSAAALDPIDASALRKKATVKVTGRAGDGVDRVAVRFEPQTKSSDVPSVVLEKPAPVKEGRFEIEVTPLDLPAGLSYNVTVQPDGQPPDTTNPSAR